MGIMAMISSPDPKRILIQYDNRCTPVPLTPENRDRKCSIKFMVEESLKGPVLVHLGFDNLFIFHRTVENSKSLEQISYPADVGDVPAECEKNPTIGFFGEKKTFLGDNDIDQQKVYPCGIYPSLFPKGQRLELSRGSMRYFIRENFKENKMKFGEEDGLTIGRNGARKWTGVNGWDDSKDRFINAKRTGLSSQENLHWLNVLDGKHHHFLIGRSVSEMDELSNRLGTLGTLGDN